MFKPILNARQKQFIHSVVSRNNGENRPILEAIVKSYILNEGLYPPATPGIPTRSHKALMESAEKELSPELKKTITFEPDCWEKDYRVFCESCEAVKEYAMMYGLDELRRIASSDAFLESAARGNKLDSVRLNPLQRAESRRENMKKCLEMLNRGEDRALIEGIILDFDYSEHPEPICAPIIETGEAGVKALEEAMGIIGRFMERHGSYPFAKFLMDNNIAIF